ncbi:hypothetical protein SAMN05877753_101377 [Bacillus oleivorans]|uniref:Uncharacterized protein n=1 Tax=Bacillus oleivorans TaxID=1448271 RepID=A0A285CJA1_9BACI|nr:hypothetical protein [Bacillus oleivorans]SNX67063.1 hypothetical protein SAMN05877753_101377 [Bacillus oleivorans]
MGGFAIQHQEGIYKLTFNEESIVDHKNINGVEIPLCSLEDWYVLYWLIPDKREKADLIENYLRNKGVKHPRLLEKALEQPLPFEVKERVDIFDINLVYVCLHFSNTTCSLHWI